MRLKGPQQNKFEKTFVHPKPVINNFDLCRGKLFEEINLQFEAAITRF